MVVSKTATQNPHDTVVQMIIFIHHKW